MVALCLKKIANYRLPTSGPHGTKPGHSWYQWKMKSNFPAGLTILKKEMCLGIVSACRVDPVVSLHLRNTANYRLPIFGSHGTILGHSWFQLIIKSDSLAGLTILKKEMCLGILNACRVDPVVSLHLSNTADYRLPTFGPHGTKLGHSWLQWIIESGFPAGLTILKKETCLSIAGGCGGDPAVTLYLRNTADYRLTTSGSHGTKLGNSWFQWKIKSDFLAGLTILKLETCLGT
jgi:hypothetical protein